MSAKRFLKSEMMPGHWNQPTTLEATSLAEPYMLAAFIHKELNFLLLLSAGFWTSAPPQLNAVDRLSGKNNLL